MIILIKMRPFLKIVEENIQLMWILLKMNGNSEEKII